MRIRVLAMAGVAVAFVLTLRRWFLLEEILLLWLLPVAASVATNGLILLFKRLIGKPASPREIAIKELGNVAIAQFLVLLVILFLGWPRSHSAEAIAADLDTLTTRLEAIHPNLYHCVDREIFAAEVDRIKSEVDRRMSADDWHRQLSRLLGLFCDGHTRSGPGFYRRRAQILFADLFPYAIRIEDERIRIVRSYTRNRSIPVGAEVLSINGRSPGAFVDEVASFGSRESALSIPVVVSNPFTIGRWNQERHYTIEYRGPDDERTRTVRVRSGLISRLRALSDQLRGVRPPHYEFKVLDGNVGYLGFYGFEDPEQFKVFLEDMFTQVQQRGVEDLIIDIRDNGGGNSVLADELMQYIGREPFLKMEQVTFRISQPLIDAGRYDWLDEEQRVVGTNVDRTGFQPKPLRDNPLRYAGRSYLLIGHRTYSSAVIFASTFQCGGLGPVLGAETSGLTVSYGDVFNFSLPRTGADVDVSYKRFHHACGKEDGRGVIPDHPVADTRGVSDRDAVLEEALEMVRASVAAGPAPGEPSTPGISGENATVD